MREIGWSVRRDRMEEIVDTVTRFRDGSKESCHITVVC